MRFPNTAARAGSRWPRVVGAVALAVLGVCGVIVLVIPSRASAPTSLASRSNWVLAGALPASHDFPANWGYGFSGPVRRTALPPDNVVSTTPSPAVPRVVYAPPACTTIPKILDHSDAGFGPILSVDRYTELWPHSALTTDSAATGEYEEVGPSALMEIWIVPDGPARIANYVDWLGHCGTYQVTYNNEFTHTTTVRTATTVVEGRSADGADAAVNVTRTFTTASGRKPPTTYQVSYYAVRGVILESSIYGMEQADRDLVQRRTTETVRRLRAL